MSDEKLQQLYNNFLEFADHMCVEHGPMEVAAIMMAQALTIYKSALSEEDYNRMVDNISASRTKVKTFSRPVLQ
jgi:two-component SAPR family response regulator